MPSGELLVAVPTLLRDVLVFKQILFPDFIGHTSSLCLLNTQASNFTADIHEFSEFEPHRQVVCVCRLLTIH